MSTAMNAEKVELNVQQSTTYIAVIESLYKVTSEAQLLQWTQGELQSLLPHETFIFGVGHIDTDGIRIDHLLSSDFPTEEYLHAIRRPDGTMLSPVMERWCEEGKPQLFEIASAPADLPAAWLRVVQKYQLRNIAAHGMRDLSSNVTTYFNFSRIPGKLTPQHGHLLKLLVPHMHVALVRVLGRNKLARQKENPNKYCISRREYEILQWIQQGKTSKEIAQRLNITEKTVRNHAQHTLVKLGVKNRVQAVRKAVSLNILDAK